MNDLDCMQIQLPLENVKTGFVQTYYANTASSNYLKTKFGLNPVYAATGVKHLHEKAAKFDLGVYFESNGHGTVLFETGLPEKVSAMLINRDIL
jgi:phosphomannomutase